MKELDMIKKSKKRESQKGMWLRTIKLFTSIRVPIHLYILEVVLGIVSTKVSLLYIPYYSKMQTGAIDTATAWTYLGLAGLNALISLIVAVPSFYAAAIVARRIQEKLISRSLRLPMPALEFNASQMVSWITNDPAYADGFLTAIVGFITGAATVYMSIASMKMIDTALTSLVPFLAVYMIFCTWFNGKVTFLRQRRGKRASAELIAYLAEHLSFFTQIKQLHSRQEEGVRGKEAIDIFYGADIYQATLTFVNNIVAGNMQGMLNILVIALGIGTVRSGEMTMDDLVAFQSFILLAYSNISSLLDLYFNFMYYNGELFYISKLMDSREEKYKRSRTMDTQDEDIIFENVSFSYGDDGHKVLDGASFTIPKGKLTMIAGANGCGKTTTLNLIERFYTPTAGRIMFGQTPAEEFHLDEWRKNIAYVLQEPQLFNGTVRENITYGMEREPSQEEIEAAARIAYADEFIGKLPGGYDFNIGDNGTKLSGGQRQRIAIARAVLTDPNYLLLDEATCNLDAGAEREVTDAMLALMEGRTTVMITHDMKLLDRADNIIVISDGKIEASGTVAQAKKESATLRAMLKAAKDAEIVA